MIPKIIHYCWFGGNSIPLSVQACIGSWRKLCPSYEIRLWNEDNFDIHSHPYMEEAYASRYWAFVSDLARLFIVYRNGGIYLDTDVELIKPLDAVLDNSFFFAIEKDTNIITNVEFININTGLGFGAEAGNEILRKMINEYSDALFKSSEGTPDLTPCTRRNSQALAVYGFCGKDRMMKFSGGTIYPSDYFCPEEFSSDIRRYTDNTISIHHYNASWKTRCERIMLKIKKHTKKVINFLLVKNFGKCKWIR